MNDPQAVYEAYGKQVYAYVRSLGASVPDAEDVTQETFARAIKGIDRFRGESALSTWLCQIARNVYLTDLRRSRRLSDEAAEPPDDGIDLIAQFADRESALVVHRALHRLDEPYREVFALRVLGELSFAGIASVFGRTEGWARVTFHRAKLKLRKELQ